MTITRIYSGVHFVLCSKQGNKIEGVVLITVGIEGIFCPKEGQGFNPSAAHLYHQRLVMVEYPSRERGPTTKRNIYLTPLIEIGNLYGILEEVIWATG